MMPVKRTFQAFEQLEATAASGLLQIVRYCTARVRFMFGSVGAKVCGVRFEGVTAYFLSVGRNALAARC